MADEPERSAANTPLTGTPRVSEHVCHDVRGDELDDVLVYQVTVRPLRPDIIRNHHRDDTHPGLSRLLECEHSERVGGLRGGQRSSLLREQGVADTVAHKARPG
jgi:hypothetical protein